MGYQNPEISILLLDDEHIAELNRRYLQREGPTDVISFPQSDAEFPGLHPEVLGDIVISVPTARRQADVRGTTMYAELMALMIHGALHCAGFDHASSRADARAMKAREKSIYNSLLNDAMIRDAVTS